MSGLPMGFLFISNFLYEIIHFTPMWPLTNATYCSSVLVTNDKNETLLGRNWDFAFPESLNKMIYIANNYKGGKLRMVSVEIVGFLGVI